MRYRRHTLTALLLTAATASPAAQPGTVTGTWVAEPATARHAATASEPRMHLQLRTDSDGGRSSTGRTLPLAAFTGLPGSLSQVPEARFELRRDAGVFRFEGQFREGRGIGEFRFEPDAGFERFLTSRGETDRSARQMLSLAFLDVSRAFIQETEQAFPGISLRDIVAFRIHGVTPEFRADLARRGFRDLDPDELVKARIHGVTPAYVDQMRTAGVATEDLDGLVALRIHGVTREFMQAMASAGYTGLTARELTEARIHGVSPEFVRQVQAAGYRNLPLRDLVKMRIHRVTPAFIASLADAGYRDLPISQLVEFRIHGVDAAFVEELKKDGYTGLSARELVEIRIHARRWLPRRAR